MKRTSATVGLTNPDKVLFPRDGLTKRDVVDYLTAVAPVMLPHLHGRPIALQRWPHGIHGEAWFQQRAAEKRPEFVHGIDVGGRTHLLVENVETLQWLGNLAALTLHQWSSHAPTLDVPDYVVFDLDPGDGTWAQLIEVADALHRTLDGLELPSFVKTSGKRGLHVLVPLAPKAKSTHEAVTEFAGQLADGVARALPKLATTERMKAARGGRLYVDFLQNGRGKTIVAPYTLRALDGAPVSTPLDWSEVTTKLDPSRLGIRTVLERLKKKGDPWAKMLPGGARLPRLK
ncbi:MAG: non-homologous end-joining DNA ligase [Polyangiales bacterium]